MFSHWESFSQPPTAAILRGTPLHVGDHQVDTINSEYKTPRPLLSTVGLKRATMRWLNFGTASWKGEHRGVQRGAWTNPPWLRRDRHRGYVWTRLRTEKKWKHKNFEVKEVKKCRRVAPPTLFCSMCVRCDNGEAERRSKITETWQGRRIYTGIT